MQIKGKVGLVTGGTRGIGAAVAIALAKEGADVAIVGRTEDDDARQTRAAIQALGRRCELILADCAKPADCTRAVEEAAQRLGGVDVLVHSAGGPVNGGLLELTPEAWHGAFDVHVHAIFYLCRAAISLMRPKKEGAIVLISSTAGKLATPSHIAYQAVKGAIPHITRGLAREFAPDNIRINCVAPGVIRTKFHEKMSAEQKKLNLEQRIPLKREGTPEQVADAILMLVKNDYITGDTVTIDGGLTMRIA
ncbi:MAG: Short-chain dehydrogenase/reductase SDR [Limisphaerales bacterium]|nr:MAG: Short-chain dehydrogenase/reductase SDR [Limisphaerales bacterium]KAG0510015.1 MAG: Short-chain dehydrogenase/reductase SDR [Limisphaerales bacterium]TXT53095.1 MAG: Short-chain dehydrogenase/reductase SDR [Limisphaerales bacterium]